MNKFLSSIAAAFLVGILFVPFVLQADVISTGGGGAAASCSGDINAGCSSVLKVNGSTPGGTCTNQVVTSLSSSAVPTCATVTSAKVDTSIALTGTDINTSNQVTATHLAGALPAAQGGLGSTSVPSSGQVAVGNAGGTAYAPVTLSQDCTLGSTGVVTCTKTNNVSFATSATTDTTNATNISSGALPAGRLPALTGDVTTSVGTVATTAVGSSNLQQAIMPINTSLPVDSAAATTLSPTTPTGTINGDLMVAVCVFGSATPGAFTPPAGYTAITGCTASGNASDFQAWSHTASGETPGGANIFSWVNSVRAGCWIGDFRNAAVDVCSATTAATATTFTSAALTAAATTDRVVAIGAQPSLGSTIGTNVLSLVGTDRQFAVNIGMDTFSYPISSTTVAAFVFLSASNAVWTGAQLALSFAASSTAAGGGAVTYNQIAPAVQSLQVIGASNGTSAYPTNLGSSGIQLPNDAALAWTSVNGVVTPQIALNNAANLLLGNTTDGSIIPQIAIASATKGISTTTGTILSTGTGKVGSTGGGHLAASGGTSPTLTAGCNGAGSAMLANANCTASVTPFSCCTGAGTGTCPTASDTRGAFSTQNAAATTCTMTFNVAFTTAPICIFADGQAQITPVAISEGASTTTTAVADFVSSSNRVINYICLE